MLIRFHNSRRQLTAVIYAWRALVIGVVFSLWWFIKQFGSIYSVSARNSMWEPSSPAVQPMVVGHSDAWFGLHFYHDSFTFGSRLFILLLFFLFLFIEIGRASCREGVFQYVLFSVVAVSLK